MEEINSKSIEKVTGGYWHFMGGWAAGHALDYAIGAYVDYWDRAVEEGWGKNPGEAPRHSNY
ncbi:hypothetical protein [Ferrimonas marina]|uniref:Uncharacterized protein n=1 Tax=Ferrimonas marina TaxID=299255 RepID=A0A1M5XT78_9GAMM|nr:hypothetical protein [Ferrimonas marina]SHI02959.1 hypothetical protein SAMN02745129_3677 [Ferrimonas marina]